MVKRKFKTGKLTLGVRAKVSGAWTKVSSAEVKLATPVAPAAPFAARASAQAAAAAAPPVGWEGKYSQGGYDHPAAGPVDSNRVLYCPVSDSQPMSDADVTPIEVSGSHLKMAVAIYMDAGQGPDNVVIFDAVVKPDGTFTQTATLTPGNLAMMKKATAYWAGKSLAGYPTDMTTVTLAGRFQNVDNEAGKGRVTVATVTGSGTAADAVKPQCQVELRGAGFRAHRG